MPGHGVLVVDDDRAARTLMMEWLEAKGYEVRFARNGREALSLLQHDAPSVMVVDLDMPVMNGAELRRWQLAMPTVAEIPFILVSGAQDANSIARDLEMSDVLFKPCHEEELLRIVAEHWPSEG